MLSTIFNTLEIHVEFYLAHTPHINILQTSPRLEDPNVNKCRKMLKRIATSVTSSHKNIDLVQILKF